MKILFYAFNALWYEHLSILLDEAVCMSEQGNEVYFVYNDCSLGICTGNLSQCKSKCKLCHRRMQKAINLLPKSVTIINLKEYWQANEFKYEYNTVSEIKDLVYKNVRIGYAVMASYISMTRNLNPRIDNESRAFFDKLINASCNLTDALEKAIDSIKPDRICFFNSRFFEWRPPYDLAISKGIEAISYEKTAGTNGVCKVRFFNTTPHNIRNRHKCCKEKWDCTPITELEKIALGESFYIKRRKGIFTNDKVYVSDQKQGLLPVNWDDRKRNIVIFNSSEDEFASIGDEYEQLALFKSQYKGINYIAKTLKNEKDVHLYLRIHPNLGKVPYRYHTELLNLSEKYKNLTVIPASDSVSTYAMMDAAEKVVVFGSTMGVEAVYWGKPVILLAGACYYYSNICYIPKSTDELDKMLLSELKPKDKFEAVKWGFDFLYRNPEDYYKHIDFNSEMFNVGRHQWLNIHSLKLFGSSKLYALYDKILRRLERFHDSYNDVPYDEDMNAEL